MKRVRVTRDAARDLDELWLYIARDSVEAANRHVDELTSRFPLLGSAPEMGGPATRSNLGSGVTPLATTSSTTAMHLNTSRFCTSSMEHVTPSAFLEAEPLRLLSEHQPRDDLARARLRAGPRHRV